MKTYAKTILTLAIIALMNGCGDTDSTNSGCSNGICTDGNGGSTDSGLSTLKIKNMDISTSDICQIFSTPNSSGSWGLNVLENRIPPGYYVELSTSSCNTYWDLKIVYCDGYEPAPSYDYYRPCGTTVSYDFSNRR